MLLARARADSVVTQTTAADDQRASTLTRAPLPQMVEEQQCGNGGSLGRRRDVLAGPAPWRSGARVGPVLGLGITGLVLGGVLVDRALGGGGLDARSAHEVDSRRAHLAD